MSEQFLYRFVPGERPELADGPAAWTGEDRAVAARHVEYLEAGAAAGTVILAGRSQDWLGPAVVILEAEDEAEARRFMEGDPFVARGLFGAELHPFRVAVRRS